MMLYLKQSQPIQQYKFYNIQKIRLITNEFLQRLIKSQLFVFSQKSPFFDIIFKLFYALITVLFEQAIHVCIKTLTVCVIKGLNIVRLMLASATSQLRK